MKENKTATELSNELALRTWRLKIAQTVLIIVIAFGVGWLIFLYSSLQGRYATLQTQFANLAAQRPTTLAQIQASQNNVDGKINDLQAHVDCLFKLATTPHTTTSPPQIGDIHNCQIVPATTSSNAQSVAPRLATTPSKTQAAPAPTTSATPTSSAATTPKPAPKPNIVQHLLNLLGL